MVITAVMVIMTVVIVMEMTMTNDKYNKVHWEIDLWNSICELLSKKNSEIPGTGITSFIGNQLLGKQHWVIRPVFG